MRNAQIAENLDRAELTELERSKQIAEWISLTEAKVQSAQVEPIESKRTDGRGHRPESGINAAVRELGVERNEAQRAVKIASIAPEAEAEVVAAGLEDNQAALLEIAKGETPEEQVQTAQEIVAAIPKDKDGQPKKGGRGAVAAVKRQRRGAEEVGAKVKDWKTRILRAFGAPALWSYLPAGEPAMKRVVRVVYEAADGAEHTVEVAP